MTIKVGDKMPKGQFTRMGAKGPEPLSSDDLFRGKKVVLFSVPGAFTPTCSAKHLPGFVNNVDQLKAKGVDTIACTSVNDAYVMNAWAKASGADGKIMMLADGNCDFARAIGLNVDRTKAGMGERSRRYSMIVDDGVVRTLNVEDKSGVNVSGVETILGQL